MNERSSLIKTSIALDRRFFNLEIPFGKFYFYPISSPKAAATYGFVLPASELRTCFSHFPPWKKRCSSNCSPCQIWKPGAKVSRIWKSRAKPQMETSYSPEEFYRLRRLPKETRMSIKVINKAGTSPRPGIPRD